MIVGAKNWQQMPSLAYTQCWQGKPNSAIEAILAKHNVADFSGLTAEAALPKHWLETCGTHSAANCAVAVVSNVAGFLAEFSTPGGFLLRPPDVLALWMNEPKNQATLDAAFPQADPNVMDNEYRQEYPLAVKDVFGLEGSYIESADFDFVKDRIAAGKAVELGLVIGHFIAAYAYDEATDELIYADPADYRHPDGHYADARMGREEFAKTVTPAVVMIWEA